VQTDSSAWATELRNLSSALLARLNAAMPRRAGAGYPRPTGTTLGAVGAPPPQRRGDEQRTEPADDLISLLESGSSATPRRRADPAATPAAASYPRPASGGELRGAIERIAVLGPNPPSWRRGRSSSGGWDSRRG
jgi:hypothetical protein